MTVRMSVVLPAPLRPIRPTISPRRDRQREAAQRLHRLDGDVQRSSISSSARPAHAADPGDVAAHVGIAQHLDGRAVGDDPAAVEGDHPARRSAATMSMSCSTKSTVAASPSSASMTRSMVGNFSSALTPEVGSSSSSSFGWRASAMAMSSSLRTPPASSVTRPVARRACRPKRCSSASARSRRPASSGRRQKESRRLRRGAGDQHVVEHRQLDAELRDLERAADAAARDRRAARGR